MQTLPISVIRGAEKMIIFRFPKFVGRQIQGNLKRNRNGRCSCRALLWLYWLNIKLCNCSKSLFQRATHEEGRYGRGVLSFSDRTPLAILWAGMNWPSIFW